MEPTLYLAATVAVICDRACDHAAHHPLHALLYLIVSLLAVAMVFFRLGLPFAAALEVIVYAGAIMVLFVFVVMMLTSGGGRDQERRWMTPGNWIGPFVLSAVLFIELLAVMSLPAGATSAKRPLSGQSRSGCAVWVLYMLGVELASMLLARGTGRRLSPRPRKTEKRRCT